MTQLAAFLIWTGLILLWACGLTAIAEHLGQEGREMTIYESWHPEDEHPIYFGTLKEAKKYASNDLGIEKLTLIPDAKTVVLRLLNDNGGYVVRREIIQ